MAKPKENLTTLEFIQAWESYWTDVAPEILQQHKMGTQEEMKAAIDNWDLFVACIHAAEVSAGCSGERTPGKNINLRCRVIFREYQKAGYQAPMLVTRPPKTAPPTTIAQMLEQGILKAKKLGDADPKAAK